ncbi:thioredoxin domain-containing protein [Naasia sp. SYSU D00057]|uniref:thioredoxin domain-containing protein n=1 Tax=Naasia sp. SYSU D00057 TaxID=2817380 RepID=UPI001B316323|nr:thioredoxin domain-containing protein [Naasia sp. SYSU D00057]
MNRLDSAVSPYLRSHADNPVDWRPWGEDAFDEAERRDVPVLVSIGYATCHWCHVMARESFSDPGIAAYLNEHFVAIKVDREEHPDVDSTYMAAASAFTPNLGWPLNVFATPDGRAFYAGTYSPPRPMAGHPSFRQVLEAVDEAWRTKREEVDRVSGALAEALVAPVMPSESGASVDFGEVAEQLLAYEDHEHGGFGGAPKFPVAPVLLLALRLGRSPVLPQPRAAEVGALARRTLAAMAASGLRDPVEGGFFRYATKRDWTEPHYERMLYDNAQLLRAYAEVGDADTAAGIVSFLTEVLRRPSGAFGSAQDSESFVNGERTEGGYYALDAAGRADQPPPAVDGKVLTGWNGLAIGALATAARRLGRPEWTRLAEEAADAVLASARTGRSLLRATLDGRQSPAPATLEDYGMLARGLLELALASGEVHYAKVARELVDDCRSAAGPGQAFAAPGGPDSTLARRGLALAADTGEGAYPSGTSEMAVAAMLLNELTGEDEYREAAELALAPLAAIAASRPISLGGALEALARLQEIGTALIVVGPEDPDLAAVVQSAELDVAVSVTEEQARAFADAGFGLFADRAAHDGRATAYLCEGFVCRLPTHEAEQVRQALTTAA